MIGKDSGIQNLTEAFDLNKTTIRKITETRDGVLIVGTSGKGVVLANDFGVCNLQKKDGLISDMVNDVLVVDNHEIWCATNQGISQIICHQEENGELKIDEIINHSEQTGLAGIYISKLILWNHKIWAISESGIISFDKAIKPKQYAEPKVHILSVNYKDSSYASGKIFDHNQNDLAINYVAISTKKPATGSFYQYKLISGSETGEWQVTNSQTVEFAKIAPGQYNFMLRARTENGEWSAAQTLKFEILSHWTEKGWVRALGIAIILCIIYLVYRAELRRRQDKLEKQLAVERIENKLNKAELEVLRNQMNPHFMYNR